MIPEKIMNTQLQASSDIQSLVAERIYPGLLPEKKPLPAIVFRRIDAHALHRPLAVTGSSSQLSRARMRVFVLTASEGGYSTAQTLMGYVRAACANKIGTIAGFANVHIGPPQVAPELPDPEIGMTVDAVDFMVTYREPT